MMWNRHLLQLRTMCEHCDLCSSSVGHLTLDKSFTAVGMTQHHQGFTLSDSKVSCLTEQTVSPLLPPSGISLHVRASTFPDTAMSPAEHRSSPVPEGEASEWIKEGFVQRNGLASVQSVCDAGSLWKRKHLHNSLKNGQRYYDMK